MRRTLMLGCVLMGVVIAVGAAGGCADPLTPDNAYRTPYARYAQLRGEAPPQEQHNPTGPNKPALRQRLRPMDRP